MLYVLEQSTCTSGLVSVMSLVDITSADSGSSAPSEPPQVELNSGISEFGNQAANFARSVAATTDQAEDALELASGTLKFFFPLYYTNLTK